MAGAFAGNEKAPRREDRITALGALKGPTRPTNENCDAEFDPLVAANLSRIAGPGKRFFPIRAKGFLEIAQIAEDFSCWFRRLCESLRMSNTNHIETAIMFVRACGPVTRDGIAREIRIQAQGATKENCGDLADKAISHGMDRGWLEKYDEESYCIA